MLISVILNLFLLTFFNSVLSIEYPKNSESFKKDSVFTVQLKVINSEENPLQDASVYAINLDDFNNIVHLGETNEEGIIILQLNKKTSYGYLFIEYVLCSKFYITIKEKKDITVTAKMKSNIY
jgi:hypothetical protein